MENREITTRSLYYPNIEIDNPSWLLSSLLFWDKIKTITPDTPEPYVSNISKELYDANILKPYRSTPNRAAIVNISRKISTLIADPQFSSIIGDGHWAVRQAKLHRIYPEKIESNLLYELEEAGMVQARRDGLYDMEAGLANAYMHLLALEIAKEEKISVTTDKVLSYRAVNVAQLLQDEPVDEFNHNWRDFDDDDSKIFVDACINEMMLTWFKIDPETSPKKIIKFRKQRKNELDRMKEAICFANSDILTGPRLAYSELCRNASVYANTTIKPAYDDLEKLLKEEKINFIPDALEAVMYSEIPGALAASIGQTWALVAAPLFGLSIRATKYLSKRQNTLEYSPWSYLYRARKLTK